MRNPGDSSTRRLSARARGTVQGVGFRMFVLREALRLGLRGYVRNCPDGSVETVAEGPEEKLWELEALLRRGPALSSVSGIETEWTDAAGEFDRFDIRR